MNKKHTDIILFDGFCHLCSGAVKFIIKNDRRAVFKFAALQSPVIQQLLKKHGLLNNTADTVVYFKEGKVYTKSTAALEVLKAMGWPWKVMYVFIVIPQPIRDFMYDLVARWRYRMFGKRNTCMTPTTNIRNRFIE